MSSDKFVLDPNRGDRKTLHPFDHLYLTFYKAQKRWRFAIFQAHAQENNITLSLSAKYSYGHSVTGSDVAVLFPFPVKNMPYPLYLKSENNKTSYQTDLIPVPYEDGGKYCWFVGRYPSSSSGRFQVEID